MTLAMCKQHSDSPKHPPSSTPNPKAFVKAPRHLLRDWRISVEARLLLLIIRSYAHKGDECWPSARRLSIDMGRSERMVFRYINELEDNRLIRRRRKDPNNPKSPTVFTLLEKFAENRLQKLADPDRNLKPLSLSPVSVTSLSPVSDEVEEPLLGPEGEPLASGEPENVIHLPKLKKARKRAEAPEGA